MEEYMETGTAKENTDMEVFTDTVSGNDAGMEAGESPTPEETAENDAGQDELLESLNALVEALTPAEEEKEGNTEEGTETETETAPSETETAILELLERIYAEMTEGRTADTLYYEAWMESQTALQEKNAIQETWETYKIAIPLGILFLCACLTGIQIARTVWERFL